MLCNVCCEGLQGIWDPLKTKRVCLVREFIDLDVPDDEENDKFVIRVDTYKTVEPYDPDLRLPQNFIFGHHLTEESFNQSVRDGCVMCHSFAAWRGMPKPEPDPKITALGYYSLFSVEFQAYPTMFLYVNDSRGGFDLTPLAASLSSPFSPKRLLKLEDAGRAEPVFRLVGTAEIEPGTRYVTLSHCCDSKEGDASHDAEDYVYVDTHDVPRLTESTLTQLSNPNPLALLPLTFRDAFSVVKRLGLAHLWVDCLCVLQDDPNDRLADGNQTHNVFRNSFLSIAASGATSPSSGLFFNRDPALVAPTVFNFPIDGGGTVVPHMSSLEVPRGWSLAFNRDPLTSSTHAVPERLLAPRVVHFGSRMVFWECHGASCAEIHPLGVNEAARILSSAWSDSGETDEGTESEGESRGQSTGESEVPSEQASEAEGEAEGSSPAKNNETGACRQDRPWKTLLGASGRPMKKDPVSQLFSEWTTIVATFAHCTPTTPKDRLVGLRSVAREMKQLLRDKGCTETDYLAGMWKAALPCGLLWNVRVPERRPAEYRAPSWSWAAVDGNLNLLNQVPADSARGERLLCELVSSAISLSTCDEFGEVMGGSIVLKGKLVRGELHRPMPAQTPANNVLIRGFVDLDKNTVVAEPVLQAKSGCNFQWRIACDTIEDAKGGDQVFCLPVEATSWSPVGWHVSGLALDRRADGCYVRRGTWHVLVDTREEALDMFKDVPTKEVTVV
ncbi:hypothetical protein UVI_02059260 [Ustilaginoidea virens]|uniref:Heterokaryon incompatibility domain-containing protein n=1 Tax=Ustilaginoidea virens TaxID=1159556 RepID=A0A1B5L5W2_USTVR|nr:hypothetical protein UVI_02059260 [Ustilaginoidea virens]